MQRVSSSAARQHCSRVWCISSRTSCRRPLLLQLVLPLPLGNQPCLLLLPPACPPLAAGVASDSHRGEHYARNLHSRMK